MPPAQTPPQQTNQPAAPEPANAALEGAVGIGVCPYCGEAQSDPVMCASCGGRTDPLSRQATQNEMGPWFVRDEAQPFRPGCRLETIERWVRTGRVTPETVLRGPSTHQNWVSARRVPGIARLFGVCHGCDRAVEKDEVVCRGCGTGLVVERDRQHLGLSPVRPLPGRGTAQETASSLLMKEPVRPVVAASVAVPPVAVSRSDEHSTELVAPRDRVLERRVTRAKRGTQIAWGVASIAVLVAIGAINQDRIGAMMNPESSEIAPVETLEILDDPQTGTPALDELERVVPSDKSPVPDAP